MGDSSHPRCCKLDGFSDSRVSHTAADIPGHDGVDVAIAGVGIILQQRGCLHDLSRLAVSTLRNLQLKPCRLERMLALWIEPFDGRDPHSRDGTEGGDAGPRRASFHMHRAGAAKSNPATEFGARETNFVADYPEQWRVIRTVHRNGAPLSSKVIMIA
jgi:hypothetical protein